MGQIGDCLEKADLAYDDLTRIATTIGPGSFTGVRVGMAAARGLALGLSIPVSGISTLDASEEYAVELGVDRPVAVLLDARRDQAFCKIPGDKPSVFPYEDLSDRLETFDGCLCGSGAIEFISRSNCDFKIIHEESAAPIATIARLALEQPISVGPPAPLYLRSADAKKQTGFALPKTGT